LAAHNRIVESCAQGPRVLGGEPLDVNVMKFICKEFWTEVFRKQVSWVEESCARSGDERS
jgi:hypothetical protein